MDGNQDTDGIESKRICVDCIGEPFLRGMVGKEGNEGDCSYCGSTGPSYSIDEMADCVEGSFERHYEMTSDEPDDFESALQADKELDYQWSRGGDEVVWAIADAASIPEEAARDVQALLEERHADFELDQQGIETEFAEGSRYAAKDIDDPRWLEDWQSFETSLKTQARFFSRTAAKTLGELFEGIDTMKDGKGRPVLVNAGPRTRISKLYRARPFQSSDKLEEALTRPDLHVGSPSPAFAAAGRMNARGISVFYGASRPLVAMAEVRPPVGSRVVVAEFHITRPLKLLNLARLSEAAVRGSIFDPEFAIQLGRARFLRHLSKVITIPVMPERQEADYLPTQAIADYLATESASPVDGIVYPSVQARGGVFNVVLFHKAARVAEIDLPKGTKLSASSGYHNADGWETHFTVSEEVPEEPVQAAKPTDDDFDALLGFDLTGVFKPGGHDFRPPTLAVDLASVTVHEVEAVHYKTAKFDVSRYRYPKGNSDF